MKVLEKYSNVKQFLRLLQPFFLGLERKLTHAKPLSHFTSYLRRNPHPAYQMKEEMKHE